MIFGHNDLHDWHWPNHGPPIKGSPPTLLRPDELTDSESSSDESDSDGEFEGQGLRTTSSPDTSITTPDTLGLPYAKGQHSFGNSNVSGRAKQICGDVYNIINNNHLTGSFSDMNDAQTKISPEEFPQRLSSCSQGYIASHESENTPGVDGHDRSRRRSPVEREDMPIPDQELRVNLSLPVKVTFDVDRAFADIS